MFLDDPATAFAETNLCRKGEEDKQSKPDDIKIKSCF